MSLQRLTGILLIITSAASFGTLAIIGRFAYAGGLDTFTLLFLRFTFSALLLAVLLAWRREKFPRGRALAILVGMGGLGYVGQSYCYLTAIKLIPAGLVALLLYLYPTFVAILSIIFLKEKLTFVKGVALALATLGAVLTANPQAGLQLAGQSMANTWLGISLAVGGALIYSIYIVVGAGVMRQVSAIQSSTVIFASAALVYGVITAWSGAHWPTNSSGWWPVAAIALVATVIPVGTFLAGLKRIGPTNASMLSTFEPVITILLAAWLFAETLSPLSLVGGGLILAAVVLLTRNELRPCSTHSGGT